MGRLSDARKKAKVKAGAPAGGDEAARRLVPDAAPPKAEAPVAPPNDAERLSPPAPGDEDDELVFDDAPATPPAKAAGGTTKLPSSGLADDILAALKPKPARKPLPSSGLADDILGAALEASTPAASAGALADEILGTGGESHDLADAFLTGFANDNASASGLAGDVLAALDAAPAPGAAERPLEQGFEAGVLDVLLDTPRSAPRSLPSSGLAEDILPGRPAQGRASLALDEIHAFESFFEDERHEVEQLHLVLFRVASEQFAVEIDRVHEVIRVPAITRVPHLAAHIRGVVNLRGRIVPVMDLRMLMNLPPRPVDRMSRIMVLDLAKKQIGVLVDLVSEVLHVSVDDVEPPPEEMRAIDRNLVTAVARVDKRMIFILDMDKVLALK